jgi:hypothetical protein
MKMHIAPPARVKIGGVSTGETLMRERSERLLATIRKNSREEYRFTRENNRITIRTWFKADDGSPRPGMAGIDNIPAGLVDEFIEAFRRLKGDAP